MVTKCTEFSFIASKLQNLLLNSRNFRAKIETKNSPNKKLNLYQKLVLPFHLAPSEPSKLPHYIAKEKKESRFIPKSIGT